jgi:hypothetical protein
MKKTIDPEESNTEVVVWRANHRGHGRWFGRIELAFDDKFLRMGKTVIPLLSIVTVEEFRVAFRLTWKNEKGKLKSSTFCCPKVKGYSHERRDQIVNAIRSHIVRAVHSSGA